MDVHLLWHSDLGKDDFPQSPLQLSKIMLNYVEDSLFDWKWLPDYFYVLNEMRILWEQEMQFVKGLQYYGLLQGKPFHQETRKLLLTSGDFSKNQTRVVNLEFHQTEEKSLRICLWEGKEISHHQGEIGFIVSDPDLAVQVKTTLKGDTRFLLYERNLVSRYMYWAIQRNLRGARMFREGSWNQLLKSGSFRSSSLSSPF